MTGRDWSVRRHRPRTKALGATRAAATGLAVVGLVAGVAATADMFGFHTVSSRTSVAESWAVPAQVNTAPPAAPTASPTKPATALPVKVPAGAPTRLRIPAISVDTSLEALGLDTNGQLAPPAYSDAGWYAGGTIPGEIGPAVIAGHYDAKNTPTPSVFYRLGDLKIGETIQVQRHGKWLTFAVTAVVSYPQNAFPTGVVYGPTPDKELRLITCAGTYSAATGAYSDNLVVFATETP